MMERVWTIWKMMMTHSMTRTHLLIVRSDTLLLASTESQPECVVIYIIYTCIVTVLLLADIVTVLLLADIVTVLLYWLTLFLSEKA